MQFKKLLVIGAVALAAGSAFADDGAPLSRQEVVGALLQARAAGTLTPAGEGVAPMVAATGSPSGKTLADSAAEVRQARADGTLRRTGEWGPEDQMRAERANPSTSTLARASVKAEVIAARRAGELIPAGEGAESFNADRPYASAGGVTARTAMRAMRTPVAGAQ